ncbi:hypothetical protein CDL15_Pgr001736 [Punica granatum]|uniref:Uncharacterized protein n=1 Tax=Punica granatum TaxID=22663 RepID=A0A218XCS7_PUNGR|nr:hypothetical protein CDL15_Pgr001736 [Punica granatum]PKI33365.1 hypothetical protein CRG98_046231 [Punica granatum]
MKCSAVANTLTWTRRANVHYIAVVAICYTLFYVVGIWQHFGTDDLSPLSIVSKTPYNLSHTTTSRTAPLDFFPRRTSDNLLPLAAEEASARVPHFPPCHPRLSEYTPYEDVERSLEFEKDRFVGHYHRFAASDRFGEMMNSRGEEEDDEQWRERES